MVNRAAMHQSERDPFLADSKPESGQPTQEQERTVLPRGMEERREPALFKFERPGQTIEGHIAGFLPTTLEGKRAVAIFIAVNERTDQFMKIHATRQLLEKIRTTDVGRQVRITYRGEDDAVKTQGNKLRRFDVVVNTASEPRTDLLIDTSLLEMLQDES